MTEDAVGGLDLRMQLVVSEGWLRRVDEWRRDRAELPSRSAAVRMLVDIALGGGGVAEAVPLPIAPAGKVAAEIARVTREAVPTTMVSRSAPGPGRKRPPQDVIDKMAAWERKQFGWE